MTRPDLSRLSPEEKDALILALLDRVAALEARLGQPPKTPGNSGVPPSRGQKADRPPRRREPRRKRDGPGVTRDPAADPDHAVDLAPVRVGTDLVMIVTRPHKGLAAG